MSELLKLLVYYYDPKLGFFIEQNAVSFNSFAPTWVHFISFHFNLNSFKSYPHIFTIFHSSNHFSQKCQRTNAS